MPTLRELRINLGWTVQRLSEEAGITRVESTNEIDGCPLYVPDDPQHNGVLARLTVTYHDVRECKFASIYDYQRFIGWICVKNAENIEYDLHDLDTMHPVTQQSNEFFWRMGKSH